MPRVLVVLPTYNEADNIAEILRQVRGALPDADVLVVDDSSPDGTAEKAEGLDAELGHISVMRRPAKSGLGSAYRAGFRYGLTNGYDAFVEMDSDFSHDPAALPHLLAAFDRGAALAIGSRYVPGGSTPGWSRLRRFISRGGNRYANIMLGLPVRDATAGFRVYSRAAMEKIDLDSVRADGYGFQVEMAYLVHGNGGRIDEIPITFRDRELGQSKMSSRIVVEALVLVTWWAIRDRSKALVRRVRGS
ncbi:MAG: polyprenol monophosphomannose synthase [Acidimicrobiia bacterium]